MHKQRSAPDARIQKMREYEDKLARLQVASKEEGHFKAVAEWEAKTDGKIKHNVIQDRFNALKARREADLDMRRQKLAEKLAEEDAQLKAELISSQETPEQRRAKLAARARDLAAKREAERAALASQLLDRAFRENCDVLRDSNSKRILYRTLDERNVQIEQKMAQRILEEEEKQFYHELNEAERLRAEQRYHTDKAKAAADRDSTLRILEAQVKAVNERRAEESTARQLEIGELQATWRKMAEEQEATEAADREAMRRLAAELQEFNRIKRMEITDAERRERESDLRILQDALAKEAADEARENAAREKRREDVRRYRQQLALMMKKDAEETADRDDMIEQAHQQQQAKYDAEVAAREEARRRLMAEVDAIRQEQIFHKRMLQQKVLEDKLADRHRLAEEELLAATETAHKRAQEKKHALERRLDIQTQMIAKAHIKAAEEDDKLRELELSAAAEQEYIGKVTQVLQTTNPPQWYGRRKFDWWS